MIRTKRKMTLREVGILRRVAAEQLVATQQAVPVAVPVVVPVLVGVVLLVFD